MGRVDVDRHVPLGLQRAQGAAAGHLHQWFAHGDHAAGNTGGILATDLLIPAVMIALAARDLRHAARTVRTVRTAPTGQPAARARRRVA
ncbi:MULTISPECIES: DUF6790 family protein [Kitasatospora]|uniref:DUF6790 family protein n=1 Tax=Kitasatospora TaxID=2063 RepID=UPI000316F75C|nr:MULTISPECIES: DUF6790 family protein [Kitasatospora]